MNLCIERSNSSEFPWVARPERTCGSSGWYPFAWTMCYGKTYEDAKRRFIENHKVQIVKAKLEGKL